MGSSTRGVIFVVDDSHDLRRFVARLLTLGGHHVVQATSAPDALALLNVDPLPELVITDLMMPVMDGIEMLRAMRGNARTARIPVVIFSAWDDPQRIAAALAEGASAYWVKANIQSDEMLAEVERIIALGRAGVPEPIGHEPTPQRKADPDLV